MKFRNMRHRGQHLDEDYASGENFDENHPVFGIISWVDARYPNGHILTSVVSGPMINPAGSGLLSEACFTAPRLPQDVSGDVT